MRLPKGVLVAILVLVIGACMFRMRDAPDGTHMPPAAVPAEHHTEATSSSSAVSGAPPKSAQDAITTESIPLNDANLCRLYCNCSASDVDRGTVSVLHTLNAITAHPYFRYFKVNTEKRCPYWAVSLLCTSAENTCDVCKCSESAIPQSLRVAEDMADVRVPDAGIDSAHSPDLTTSTISQWNSHWGQGSAALAMEKLTGKAAEEEEEGLPYVDLLQNPEGNTGYAGPLAAQVWQAIYRENCMSEHTEGKAESECREEAVLKTLLSGLHFSINMQVATNFYKDTEGTSPLIPYGFYEHRNITFLPNCQMYQQRIVPNSQFVENLYVLYQFVLRAIAKAKSSYLNDPHKFDANIPEEDAALHASLEQLFNDELLCRKTFDEELFFASPRGRELAPEMERRLLNVTTLMDCVTCEKCRVWGKIQAKGIATAMRIMQHTTPREGTDEAAPLSLDRGELTSLMLLARQLAFSVRSAQQLGAICSSSSAADTAPTASSSSARH